MTTAIDTLIAELESNQTTDYTQNFAGFVSTFVQALRDIQGGLVPVGTEPANTVYAGPAAGAPSLPTFRHLVGADFAFTDLTLNSLTIDSSASATPLLRFKDTGDVGSAAILLEHDPAALDPNAGNFYFRCTTFAGINLPASAVNDTVWMFGYNIAQDGSRVNVLYPALALHWESHFNVGGVGPDQMEWHLQFKGLDNVGHRPISFGLEHSGAAGHAFFDSTDTSLFDWSGVQRVKYDFSTGVTALTYYAATTLIFDTNNSVSLIQKNVAGSGYIALIYLDNTNTIQLGSSINVTGGAVINGSVSATTGTFTNRIQQNVDLTTSANKFYAVAATAGGTLPGYAQFTNTGANLLWGIEGVAPGIISGAGSYAGFIGTGNTTDLDLATNNTSRMSINGTTGAVGIVQSLAIGGATIGANGLAVIGSIANGTVNPDGTTSFTAFQANPSITETTANNTQTIPLRGMSYAPSIAPSNTKDYTGATGLVGATFGPTIQAGATGNLTNMHGLIVLTGTTNQSTTLHVTNLHGIMTQTAVSAGGVIDYIMGGYFKDQSAAGTGNIALLVGGVGDPTIAGVFSLYVQGVSPVRILPAVRIDGVLSLAGGASLLATNAALTDVSGAAAGTLLNAPTAGNPAKWIAINDNGTTRKIPTWI
jgi:hypothetical protein